MDSKKEDPNILIKTVKPIGDGAHTCLPKKWLGRTVKITLEKELQEVKQ